MKKQHLALWQSPCNTQRQAQELISGPDLAMGAHLLSFNRTQTRTVIGLLTGHNTLQRHLHEMGLSDNPTCRKCGAEDSSSVYILCECEALASLRHIHLGSFFLDPEDIRVLGGGGHLELCQRDRAPITRYGTGGTQGLLLRPRCIRVGKGPYPYPCSILF